MSAPGVTAATVRNRAMLRKKGAWNRVVEEGGVEWFHSTLTPKGYRFFILQDGEFLEFNRKGDYVGGGYPASAWRELVPMSEAPQEYQEYNGGGWPPALGNEEEVSIS